MFGFSRNKKIKMMAENAQKQANITGNTFQIIENGKVIMTFHPEKKQKPKNDYFIPKTAEEQAEDLKRFSEVLGSWAKGQRENQLAKKKAEGLEPCPTCQPCKTCNGKEWIDIIK